MQVVVDQIAPGFDWLNVTTALGGVLLGGLLTYFVTYQFEGRRIAEDRLSRSYSLLFAAMKIAEDLTKMEQDVRKALAKATAAGKPDEIWTRLRPSVGHDNPITISSQDLAVVAISRDPGLTREIIEIESAHRIYRQSLIRLEQLQDQFASFGLATAVEGEMVTFKADQAQQALLGPTIIQLRTLSNSIAEGVPRAANQARSVAERLGPHLKEYYKFKHFQALSFPENAGQPEA